MPVQLDSCTNPFTSSHHHATTTKQIFTRRDINDQFCLPRMTAPDLGKLTPHTTSLKITNRSSDWFGTLHLLCRINSPLNFMSLVRCSFRLLHLSHMELHHLHYNHFTLLSLVQSFILNFRLGSLVNPFHHGPFPHLLD